MDIQNTNFMTPYSSGNPIKLYEQSPAGRANNSTGKASAEAAIINLPLEALPSGRAPESGTGRLKPYSNQAAAGLNEAQKQLIQKLKTIDLQVRRHEQQHLAAAGSYACSGASFQYVVGPDGKSYAVSGEVVLDTSPIPNNPQATIIKAQVLRRAALAPSDPSGADRAIAAATTKMENEARAELQKQKLAENQSHSESKSKTVNPTNFFVKIYQNHLNRWVPGTYLNRIA